MNMGRIAKISCVLIILMLVIGFPVAATGDGLLAPQLAANATIGAASLDSGVPGVKAQRWRIWLKQLNMDREDKDAVTLVTDSFAPGGNEVLGSSILDLGKESGYDLGTAFRDSEREYEIRFLSLPTWSVETGDQSSASGHVVQFATPIGNTDFPFDYSATSQSKLTGSELNVRWPTKGGSVRFLAGCGKMALEEDMLIAGTISTNNIRYNIAADNDLWGGQIGIEAPFVRSKRLTANCYLKYGFYRNRIANRVNVTQDVGPAYSSQADGKKFCSLRECGADISYSWSPTQIVSIGTQVLLLDGVATAPGQVPVSDVVSGTGAVATGKVVYRGAWASYTFKW